MTAADMIDQKNQLREVAQCQKSQKTAPEVKKTSQELRMLSSVTLNCQVTKIVMNSGSQVSKL